MGASRAWAPHRRWTDVEESVLREQYATARKTQKRKTRQ